MEKNKENNTITKLLKPVVLYESELWTMSAKLEIRLWERPILRRIYGAEKVDQELRRTTKKYKRMAWSCIKVIKGHNCKKLCCGIIVFNAQKKKDGGETGKGKRDLNISGQSLRLSNSIWLNT